MAQFLDKALTFVLILNLVHFINRISKAQEVFVENITYHWTAKAPEDLIPTFSIDEHYTPEIQGNIFDSSENSTENRTEKVRKGPPEPVHEPRRIIRGGFTGIGPTGLDDEEATTCDEFSQNARFNPYSVLGEKWFSFYYWAIDNAPLMLKFEMPIAKTLVTLKSVLDPQVKDPIDWDARKVLMIDLVYNQSALLIERGDRGQYWLYMYVRDTPHKIEPVDIRLKQTGDNRYFAIMECEGERVYVMSRLNDIPPQKKIQDEVSKFGYRGREGRSYLYQGHKWMPIDEMDELEYWTPPSYSRERYLEQQMKEFHTDDDERY